HGPAPVTLQAGHSGQGVFADKDLAVQSAGQEQSLSAVPVGFILPMDHHASNGRFFAEALLPAQLEDPLKSQILNLAHDQNSDLATAMLVAWTIVLSRLSGQEVIILDVGGTFGKGILMDSLALNVDLSGEPDTSKLFERVKHTLRATSARQSAVDDPVNLSKNDEVPALSQARFYSHPGGLSQPMIDPVSMQCLELHLFQDKNDVTVGIRYAADLFNKDNVERYIGYLNAVLTNMVTTRGQPVASFDILSKEEKKLFLETWNETDQESIEKILDSVERTLSDAKINFSVSGRQKTIYSIYKKMRAKHISFSNVLDRYGFRIIVEYALECYQCLGILHSLYKPIPGHFKDYIAVPKVNGYQSLHTTVLGPQGAPIEFQIRTRKMHEIAESGVAAHWLYKTTDLNDMQEREH
ncbi:hypothetical protein BGZ83_003050, partial [Gryganskiella cystojenkinii]